MRRYRKEFFENKFQFRGSRQGAGVPKGMKRILEERGINTQTHKGDDMRVILANHDDFRDEKTVVEKKF